MNDTLIQALSQSSTRDTSSVSEAVVEAIADAEGVSPIDVRPPLAASIDPDALEALFGDRSTTKTVTFTHGRFDVTVRGPRSIDVSETEI